MRIHTDHHSDSSVTLTLTANDADLRPIKNQVLKKLAGSVKVGGFREGKAPLAMVEKSVDQTVLSNEFLDAALNRLYKQAIEVEKLAPVGPPEAKLIKFVPYTDLEVELKIEVFGPIVLPDYRKLKLERLPVTVSADDVNAVVKRLRTQLAERKDIDLAAKKGDEVWIDFTGADKDGKPVQGADGTDYPLLIGSNTFIPGFEEHLVGHKAHAKVEFTIPFPKDYTVAALQGRKVTFNVTVKKVQEVIEPKADDAFAAKVGQFESLAALKADIKKQLIVEEQRKADQQYENELLLKIAEESKVTLPISLVEGQIDAIERDERQNLVYRGQTWEEHLKEEGITEQEHRERSRKAAEERVKISLILSEISEREGIEITPEDLEVRMQLLKGQYKDDAMQSELAKPDARQNIANRLIAEKTIAKLVDYASA